MKNPFHFTEVATAPSFCNREKECQDLTHYIGNAQNILLFSHRRYGKTSLIHKVLGGLKEVQPFYVDLYGTTSVEEFIAITIRALTCEMPTVEKALGWLRKSFTRLTFQFSADPMTGLPSVTPTLSGSDEEAALQELFSTLESLSRKKNLVVVFDEFQETSAYNAPYFEKRIRKEIQNHQRISYLFSGSQRHMLSAMFTDTKRALYKLAVSYPLPPIETSHYVAWASALFRHGKRAISEEILDDVVQRCENHPMYVQEFYYHLWEEGVPESGVEGLERAILERRAIEFINLFSSMTPNQKRAMKLLARCGGKGLFSAKNLQSVGFSSTSQATRALEALRVRDDVVKNGTWAVADPLFKKWVLKLA